MDNFFQQNYIIELLNMKILRNILIIFSLPLIIPLIALSCFLIFLEDGLPVIFKQQRLGENEFPFEIYKIRTMKKATKEAGTHEIDPSMHLFFGSFLRKIKFDEFLQLINVLNGQLNLIGPRPGLITQLELAQERRKLDLFSIKPGVTGLSQVCGCNMSNPSFLAKVDRIYLENKSFLLDLMIIMATLTGIYRKTLKRKFQID